MTARGSSEKKQGGAHAGERNRLYGKVGLAGLIMMASVFLSRVAGLAREMIIAWRAGADFSVDAYQAAFVLPEILNHILASGFLSVTFIPLFSGYLARGEEEEAWRVFSVILTTFGALMLALIAASELMAPLLIRLVAPGKTDPAFRAAAVEMTRIMLPGQFFFFSGGLFMAVQFARERFFIPALAPLIYNCSIILGGLVLDGVAGISGFSWGVLSGAFAGNFLLQAWGARRAGMRFVPCFDPRHPDLIMYIRLSLPLMLGLTMAFSTEFFLKFFGSYLPDGGIAALNYALRIMFLLVGLFGQAAGAASFPFMARLAAENRLDEMNRLLNLAVRYLCVVMPISVLFMVLRREIVSLLFERGKFGPEAVALTSDAMLFLMAGAAAFAAQTVVIRGYFAVKDTLFPAVFGSLAVAASLPLYYLGRKLCGIQGVAAAVSLSAAVQVIFLFALWNRRTGNRNTGVGKTAGKLFLLSAVIGPALEILRRFLQGIPAAYGISVLPWIRDFSVCALTAALFCLLAAAGARLLRIPEITEIAGRLKQLRKSA
ncbi:MAG: murein biosynthesis integral membrane protein MurJ [Desulfobacterales bacterium]|nr:MAG: murein biosynthesis integral membrane protein MurJ [Desulfobacterales bacterium]